MYKKLRTAWEQELLCGPSAHHRTMLRHQAQFGKMWVQITVHHTKEFDQDNLPGAQKVILDALVNIGFLANDSADKLVLYPPVQVLVKHKAEAKTVVKIGPID